MTAIATTTAAIETITVGDRQAGDELERLATARPACSRRSAWRRWRRLGGASGGSGRPGFFADVVTLLDRLGALVA